MNITVTVLWNGQEATYTWIPIGDVSKYWPIKNVAGVCVNDKKEVLICREPGQINWGLPGGRPENNETPIQTLERELIEEVDVKVGNFELLGAQMVNFPNNPDKSEGEVFYQVRYFCKIKELLPQTLDPDTGLLYERKFVPLAKLNDYLKWGAIADEIVASSIKIDDKLKLEKSIKKGKKTKTPRLVILMGLPGCGKSYVASYLYEKYGFTILSGENITYALFGTEKCANDEYALAYKTLRQLAAKLLADGYSVVIDGTNLKYAFRQQIYDEVICDSTTLIYLKIDDKTALNRITQRGLNYQDKKNIKSSISQETFNNFKKQLEEPLPSEKAITIISDDNIFIKIDSVVNY